MEEYTGRERSPPPDPAESAAAEIPVPNSPTPRGRTFQDNFNSPQMPASPTGGQGLTQEALIEVLRNQHQNIVQQQNLIAGQGTQISELTKLVSGLVQMQTDVLKDQAQAATSSTPRAGSLFTSAPKKSDSKYSGSSGGKMESYIPNCPQLEIKDSGRRHEINTWLSFRERFGSWSCLLDECYAAELQEAVKQTTTIEQGKLAPEAAVRSSKLYHWMKQAMSGYKRGLDLAVLQEREQGGLTCGYELFRRINNLLGVTTRAEALSLREAVMRLDVNGLKQLGCPSAGSVKNPLDTCLFLTQEFARLRDQCAALASCLDRAKGASATESVRFSREKGVRRDQAPKGSHDGEASDVGDMEEIPGAFPESAPAPSEGPKSRPSSGLTGRERITSETIVRIGATPEGEVVAKRQEIKPGTAYFMKRRPQDKEKVKFTSQVRSLLRPAGNAALSVTDASTSEWMSETADPPVLELTEENLKRLDESVKQRKTPSILPIKAKTRPIGPQPPPVPPPGWQPPAKQPPVPSPKKPPVPGPVMAATSPASVKLEEILEVIAKPEEIPEPKTPSVPGPKTPPTKPKAKSRPLTEEQKAVAEEVLAQKAQDLLRKAERGTATLKREKESTASGSGAKKVPKYLEHLTDDQRAHLFRTELSSEREAEAIEWEKELARREKEEEERRKAQALYRSERRAQALEHGREIQRQRQEEFLKWKAEEEDRENCYCIPNRGALLIRHFQNPECRYVHSALPQWAASLLPA